MKFFSSFLFLLTLHLPALSGGFEIKIKKSFIKKLASETEELIFPELSGGPPQKEDYIEIAFKSSSLHQEKEIIFLNRKKSFELFTSKGAKELLNQQLIKVMENRTIFSLYFYYLKYGTFFDIKPFLSPSSMTLSERIFAERKIIKLLKNISCRMNSDSHPLFSCIDIKNSWHRKAVRSNDIVSQGLLPGDFNYIGTETQTIFRFGFYMTDEEINSIWRMRIAKYLKKASQ